MEDAAARSCVFKSQIDKAQKARKENVVEKRTDLGGDATTKASNYLIQSLMQQKELHERKNAGRDAKVIAKFKEQNAGHIVSHSMFERIPKKSSIKPIERIETKPIELVETKPLEPVPKKAKIQFKEIPDGFGVLQLERMNAYNIPPEIMNIESKKLGRKDMAHLVKIREMNQHKALDPEKYTNAYKALLYLEEAAEILDVHCTTIQSVFS